MAKMGTKDGRAKRARRAFTDEFKAGAVRLVLDEGKTVAQVARDLDLTASALGTWVERARADRTKGATGLTTEERTELAKLRKENRELKMERDLLKKWAASSTGHRYTGAERIRWSRESQGLPWPLVELPSDLVQLGLRVDR
jgi:transposase